MLDSGAEIHTSKIGDQKRISLFNDELIIFIYASKLNGLIQYHFLSASCPYPYFMGHNREFWPEKMPVLFMASYLRLTGKRFPIDQLKKGP